MIKLNLNYTAGTKRTVEEQYVCTCVFKLLEDITLSDAVILPDPLKNVTFFDESWEISGDFCVFDVLDRFDDGVIFLEPTKDMVWRNVGVATSKRRIRMILDPEELIMVLYKVQAKYD